MDTATQGTPVDAGRDRTRLGTLAQLGVLTAFWIYVTVSNVLYAHNMSLYLSSDPNGRGHLFAAWPARSLQHLLLYPVLLLCVQLALRIGWRPLPRRVPLQVVLALVFALLASPLLGVSEHLLGDTVEMSEPEDRMNMPWQGPQSELPLRIASATSFLLTYGFALALVSGFSLYQRFRDSELRRAALERAWNAARLAALRMQLSPHTLFNLLHTIRGQIEWDPAAAQAMIIQLGDLLRRLLAAGETEFTTLAAEIQFASLYLKLQQQRFADRLTLSLPEPQTLPVAWVPSLILQPLIENAVVHGLAGHSAAVTVSIGVQTTAQQLRVIIRNTTSGATGGNGGIGLRNVRERLAVHFGDRGVLLVQSGEAQLWTATVQMPLLREPTAPDAAAAKVPA
ncbi:MAG TPA: histidine kinase [Steroidobacteraceae bacterium]|nr:histidine kinase [Steroidobacteraceae bacterium]